MTNLVKQKICFKNKNGTILDVLLTNEPNRFQKTAICETGLSNCDQLVITIFRSKFIKLLPKTATCKSYQKLIQGHIYKTDNSYSISTLFHLGGITLPQEKLKI